MGERAVSLEIHPDNQTLIDDFVAARIALLERLKFEQTEWQAWFRISHPEYQYLYIEIGSEPAMERMVFGACNTVELPIEIPSLHPVPAKAMVLLIEQDHGFAIFNNKPSLTELNFARFIEAGEVAGELGDNMHSEHRLDWSVPFPRGVQKLFKIALEALPNLTIDDFAAERSG